MQKKWDPNETFLKLQASATQVTDEEINKFRRLCEARKVLRSLNNLSGYAVDDELKDKISKL